MVIRSASKSALAPGIKAKSLEQQKADYTAEGSPPPGKVSKSVPIAPDKTAKPRPVKGN